MIGIALDDKPLSNNLNGDSGMSYYSVTGNKQGGNTSGVDASYGASYTYNDVIGVALDLDSATKTLTFYKNGSSQGVAFNPDPSLGSWHPAVSSGSSSNTTTFVANFGQRSFSYAAPAGFSPLATSFLPESSIPIPSQYFDVNLWSGNSGDGLAPTQDITTSFAPSFVWVKSRTDTNGHSLFDIVRGIGKRLHTHTTGPQTTKTQTLSNFLTNGFRINGDNSVNDVGQNYVSWSWAGGDATTSIAAGSLNSSLYDQSQTWSNNITGTVDSSYKSAAELFNGTIGTGYVNGTRSTNPGTLTLNVSSLNVSASTVTLHVYIYGSPTLTVNGTAVSHGSGNGDKTVTVSVSGGQLNTIAWSYDSGSGPYCYMRGIEIDGKILVDSGVTITTPSIPSTVRSSPESGFSITKWTGNGTNGATVAHNLSGAENGMIIVKNASSTVGPWWAVYHKSLTTGKVLGLNSIQPEFDETYLTRGIIENVTSSTFTCTSGSAGSETANGSGDEHIAYAWAPIENFSSFGSYENPSSSQGAFVFLGFKPELLIIKCARQGTSTSGLGDWIIKDSTRSPFNNPSDGNTLVANVNNAEDNYYNPGQAAIDFLSNGFKIRHPNSSPGGDPGRIYIYAAWAESPFKTARAQ